MHLEGKSGGNFFFSAGALVLHSTCPGQEVPVAGIRGVHAAISKSFDSCVALCARRSASKPAKVKMHRYCRRSGELWIE